MGSRGPAPKTLEQAKLTGDKARAAELKDVPRCTFDPIAPEHLDGAALDMWNHLLEVTPPGLYTAMDMPVLVMFCETWQQRDKLRLTIAKNKSGMAKGSNGQLVVHPGIKVMRELTSTLGMLAKQLLLTPADRARLGALLVPPKAGEDQPPAAEGQRKPGAKAQKQPTGFGSLIGRKG